MEVVGDKLDKHQATFEMELDQLSAAEVILLQLACLCCNYKSVQTHVMDYM